MQWGRLQRGEYIFETILESSKHIFTIVTQFIMQSVAYRHTIVTKLFQVVPLEAPGLVDVTTWLLLGSSLTMVGDLTLTFL